jgi:hypothetical protein
MKNWIYRHYKWKLYEVLWEAKHSETLEDFVVYKALYNSEEFWDEALWVRPLAIFLEKVNVDWKEISRFEYIWKRKYENI